MKHARTWSAFLIVFVGGLCVGRSALAQAAHATSPSISGPTYRVDPRVDLPVIAIAMTASVGWMLGPQLAPAHCAPVCDRSNLWSIDRSFAGQYNHDWVLASDIMVASQFALAGAALLIDEGWEAALTDSVIVIEAITGSLALSILSNTATRRPRPHLYGEHSPESERRSGKAALSFFSGHTTSAFAAAISIFETMRRRHPGRVGNYVALGVGLAVASFVGSARVIGGQHFPTDVLAGAAVGTAMGFLVPALHTTGLQVQPSEHGLTLGLTTALDL